MRNKVTIGSTISKINSPLAHQSSSRNFDLSQMTSLYYDFFLSPFVPSPFSQDM